MGSADFGIKAFDALLQKHTIIAVVSTPSKPQGRGLKLVDSPVVQHAREKGISLILTPDSLKDSTFNETLSSLHADLFVVVAFRILPKAVFSIPRLGTVNIHASLLPKFRGPAPIHRAIEAGESETGVTIFRIDEGVDTGEMLLQERTPIGASDTTPELYERLSVIGAELLMKAVDSLEDHSIEPLIQDTTAATKAPKLTKEEAVISWNSDPANINNKIRAFKPFPGTYTLLHGKRLGIEKTHPIESAYNGEPGLILEIGETYFDVGCRSGVLRIVEVKPEGKRTMSSHDFMLGTHLTKGEKLG